MTSDTLTVPVPNDPICDLNTGQVTRSWRRFFSQATKDLTVVNNITDFSSGGLTGANAGDEFADGEEGSYVPFLAGAGQDLLFTGHVTGSGQVDSSVTLSLGSFTSAELAAALTNETGTGVVVFSTSPSLTTPALGTPSAGVLMNCTGLPVATGISGLAAGIATWLATPSSANLISAVTDETGTGALVFADTPALVTPLLGTPTSGTLTNCTGLPISSGVSGLAANVATFLGTPSSANLIAAVTDETGTGALVFANTPALITPTLGTPGSGTLTNCTGLPVSTGISGLGTGVATFLATPSSANLASAVTDETGSGALVFGTSPTITTLNWVGTSTNNDAASGSAGEYQEAEVLSGSAGSITASTATNITSLSLTAGDWDVWGVVCFKPATTTSITVMAGGVNTTSATLPTSPGKGAYFQEFMDAFVPGANNGNHYPTGTRRLSLSATTTVYLVGYTTFTVSTMEVFGILCARRRR